MKNPYQVVRDFEAAVCEYTGAPYCVAVNSCTMALTLALAWHSKDDDIFLLQKKDQGGTSHWEKQKISIPRRTYVSVPMAIVHAGYWPEFRVENWRGQYQLRPLPVWDSARWFTGGMYGWPPGPEQFRCVSFHASKTLGDTQGGAILHDNAEADAWFRRARFDGRAEGVAPRDDKFSMIGWHCYMSPDVAARLHLKLHSLPKHNPALPNDDYPELDKMEIFK